MTIKINEKEIELKFSIRALMMYENITGNSFNPTNFTDILTFFYCVVISSTKDYSLTFDAFIDYIDVHPELIQDLTDWMKGINTTNDVIKKN